MSQERSDKIITGPFDHEVKDPPLYDHQTLMKSSHPHLAALCSAQRRTYMRAGIEFKRFTRRLAEYWDTGNRDWNPVKIEIAKYISGYEAAYGAQTNEKAILKHQNSGVVREETLNDEDVMTMNIQI